MKQQPALWFLHGWGFQANIWTPFITEHFKTDTSFAPEIGGYGLAGEQDKVVGVSLKSISSVLGKDMNKPAALIGWSLGGQLAIELAAANPEKVQALFLIACNPMFIEKADWPSGFSEEAVLKMKDELVLDRNKVLREFLWLMVKGIKNSRHELKKLQGMVGKQSDKSLSFGLDLLMNEDQRVVLSKLQCPVYMLFGKQDTLVDCRVANDCADLNPRVKTECLDELGHMPFLSHSQVVADWIQDRL